MKHTKLHIDVETFSSVDIKISGAYKYTESVDFEIMLLAYAFDNEPVKIVDLMQGDKIPKEVTEALKNPQIKKYAHNAAFERNCLRQLGFEIPIEQWNCTAVKSAYCGLPISLENVSEALKLGEKSKLSAGKQLIKFFCQPIAPTKTNGGRKRNFPHHDFDKWNEFKKYCVQDVEAEREIDNLLEKYVMHSFEVSNYILDQEVNDNGILIDLEFANSAIKIDESFEAETSARLKKITNLENPNSASQLKQWLSQATGKSVSSLTKDDVTKMLSEYVCDDAISEVLTLRQQLAKTSTKKYVAMQNCVCYDGRAHGLFQFLGANRTGRWAGRLIQLQNLPQNHMQDLDKAREIIRKGDYETALLMYDNLPKVLSELIRTAFVAPEGKTFAIADFSAIEARVLSWIAGEDWRLDVFRTHGKIYEASAAMMFGVPIEEIGKWSDLRQRGKVAELALGYQGAEGAMEKMDRDGKIPPHERKIVVQKWRKANPKIVKLWKDIEECAIRTIKTGKTTATNFCKFHFDGTVFQIELPVGRRLFYQRPKIGTNKWGQNCIIFEGMNQVTKQWEDIDTYGGKLVENIVQAVARDLLAEGMQKLRANNFKIVMHVHDEVVCEVDKIDAEKQLKLMCDILGQNVKWAPGLPLAADGHTTEFYKKD